MIRIGIDTGGTFTDVVSVDGDGRVVSTKVPSTPSDPSVAFMRGVEKAGTDAIAEVFHGTTVATNALLEDDFGGLGFITTEGFRGVLEIGRQSVPDSYGNSYFWVKPDRIVPLHLVQEVQERVDHTGAVVRQFDEEGAREVARWFRAQGVTSIGVCFLHSYMNPDHERRMRDVLAAEHPDCAVSLSSDVLSEYREYERAVTTLVDAFVKPRVSEYARSIEDRLGRPFYIMKSNGGVIAGSEVGEKPITTILSGPAAGTLGAALVAEQAGFRKVITLDGGGTSTDVAVINDGRPSLTTEGAVGRFAVKVPMVDVVTVGTGGGSIAWVSPEGTLKVGPRSAGASPGPACYPGGGREPTTTDAFLLLGHIPEHLLGGEIPLHREAAEAVYERLAGSVGLGVEACAAGVLEIAAWNQANAIRQVTVKRGLDVRDFDLCAFGGSGPLTACRLIDILGLRAVFVPRDPGNLSAFGLLATDLRSDHVQTLVRRHDQLALGELGGAFARLEADAAAALERQGHALDGAERSADLRYYGQAFEIHVPAPDGPVDAAFVQEVEKRFHDAHERSYGYCYRDDPGQVVEWVNLRVTGIGAMARPALNPIAPEGDPLTGRRDVFFGDRRHDTPIYARARLSGRIEGPAVIEEFGSTLPIHPGFTARIDELGNVVVSR
ncbi:MAG TPA: hydantoinase/oxoprolinase family protein [Solirubrobacteraceae bacterium]|nr:hydantoinase/oxoprolinase family protein [Solirubrobacteraceae bacterium]